MSKERFYDAETGELLFIDMNYEANEEDTIQLQSLNEKLVGLTGIDKTFVVEEKTLYPSIRETEYRVREVTK